MEEDQGQNLEAAIDNLLYVERKMRRDGDVEGTRKAVVDILKLCYEAGAWNKLNEQIVLLFKRRGQSTEAKKDIVSKVTSYILEKTTDAKTQTELFKTINSVTAGKKDFDLGRARLIGILALRKNKQGLFTEAANMIMKVEVETIDEMDKFEKTQFILDQVRLCLDNHDYVRAKIVSRKISPKAFDYYPEEGNSFLRVQRQLESHVELQQSFYQLMIRYHSHSNDYLEISGCYKSLYEIPSLKQLIDRSHTHSNDSSDDNNDIFFCWCYLSRNENIEIVEEEDPAERILPLLRKICWYLVLSPHGLEQSQLLMSTLENDKNLSEIPRFKSLLNSFATMEVIQWNAFWNTFKDEFEDEKNIIPGLPDDCSLTEKQAEVLKLRVIEHVDIRVIATYYSRITMKRLADLLGLSVQEAEKHLCDMVVSKSVFAKIDRPLGVVCFQTAKGVNEILDSWAYNLEKLLDLVDKSCDKIHKEMK